MPNQIDAIRAHLVNALDWQEAHAGFDKAVAGIPPGERGAQAPGFEHSAWQIVEHIRIAQADILDFCVNPAYQHARTWPDEYWPRDPGPASAEAWNDSLTSYAKDLAELRRLGRDVPDLTAPVPTGKRSQTYLRALLLVVDHTAYHVGQLIDVRRALGIWK